VKYLEENFAAAKVELTSEEVANIRSLVDNAASGAKWPESMDAALFADTPLLDSAPLQDSGRDNQAFKGNLTRLGKLFKS
jgi:hypothetical protein